MNIYMRPILVISLTQSEVLTQSVGHHHHQDDDQQDENDRHLHLHHVLYFCHFILE